MNTSSSVEITSHHPDRLRPKSRTAALAGSSVPPPRRGGRSLLYAALAACVITIYCNEWNER